MTEKAQEPVGPIDPMNIRPDLPSRRAGMRLFLKIFLYHLVLAIAVVTLSLVFPSFTSLLPIGGVTELVKSGDLSVALDRSPPIDNEDIQIVNTVIKAAGQLKMIEKDF